MTSNIVSWLNVEEAKRSNVARELETRRHNVATEIENWRSNVMKEVHNRNVLAEEYRHNVAAEMNQRRQIDEQTRSNRAKERLESDRNVLQGQQNRINLLKAHQESADRRHSTRMTYLTSHERNLNDAWYNARIAEVRKTEARTGQLRERADWLLGSRKLDQEYELGYANLRLEDTKSRRQYNVGMYRNEIEHAKYKSDLLFKVADKLPTAASFGKKLYNQAILLGY